MQKRANILIIGFGHHARRIYYPVFKKWGRDWNSEIVCAVDLKREKSRIESHLKNKKKDLEILYLEDDEISYNDLPHNVRSKLNGLVGKYKVNSVIISTEPLSHLAYAKWALKKGLNILMDKPISTKESVSTSLKKARGIVEDYYELARLYKRARTKNPNIIFSLMTQRRYHKAIEKIRELLREIFYETNCPVTAIQINHGDGQWRTPNEIIDVDYHPFNQGYGVCSHSGYHFFDVLLYLLQSAEKKESLINNVDILANSLTPSDLLSQLNFDDYRKLFPEFDEYNPYTEEDYLKKVGQYGEVDTFASFVFKHNNAVVTLGAVNLLHNNFSQRGWLSSKGRDLYKGNGRLRHESYQINQGPFQTIYYFSFQGKEIDPSKQDGIYDIGGEYHAEIHVFRNDVFNPKWNNYDYFSIKDLNKNVMEGGSRGHIEDAKRLCIKEFVDYVNDKIKGQNLKSEFGTHLKSTLLFSGVCQSNAKRRQNKNPLVNIRF